MNWDLFVAGALIGAAVWGAGVCISSVVVAAWRERGFWERQGRVIECGASNPERN